MGHESLWAQAAETIMNVRRRVRHADPRAFRGGATPDQDIQSQLAAMEAAVAARDVERLSAVTNQVLSMVDRLETAHLSRMGRLSGPLGGPNEFDPCHPSTSLEPS